MIMVKKQSLQMTEGTMIQLLYIPWNEEGHTGQVKLQSSVILTLDKPQNIFLKAT